MDNILPNHPDTMKAWLYSATAGGLENNLSLSPSTRTPGPLQENQVLVQVISASINPADYKVPEMGLPARAFLGLAFPASPGMDFCGRIVTMGDGVKGYEAGQLVFGCLGKPGTFGSLGEYLFVSTDGIAALPEGVEPDHAATVGVAGQTAYQAVAPYVNAGVGERVFINGGSGGCGTFAIQIAKVLGCHVTTTCSTRNVQFCRDLGADEVIDYTTEDVVKVLKSHGLVYSLVVDHIGLPNSLYRECDAFLLPGKSFVQVGAGSMLTFANRMMVPSFLGGGKRKYDFLMMKNKSEHIAQVGEWIQQGKVKVELDSVFEYEDAVKAFEKLRSGRSRGKIVVHVTKA